MGQDALPTGVLWDMDGTIVDTEPYWIRAEHDLVESYGGTWTDELAHGLVGNPLLVSARMILDNSPVRMRPEEVVDALLESVTAQMRRAVPWRPGARELLAQARAAGVPNALVTMSYRSFAQVLVDALPEGTFSAVVTGDEVSHGKPHPEPYLAAARALQVSPQDALAIEDSPTGVRSAVAAGVPTIGVPHVVPVPDDLGAALVPGLDGHDLQSLLRLARAAR